MKKDFCVRCGSENLEDKIREIDIPHPNPGTIIVSQECNECQECGGIYFNKKQIKELSVKIKDKQRQSCQSI